MIAQRTNPPNQYAVVFWLSLLLVILAAVALRIQLLNSFPLSPDEGIHLMWLRLMSAGYQPYTEVYVTYPPLYPIAIEAIWQLWPTETAQRWFSVAYTVFGAIGIALLARKFAGPVAGVAAAGLTLFSPPLVEPSRAVLGEFPSVAWSVWAIWLAWLYRDAGKGRYGLLILSGLCLSASLLTKLLSPFVAVLIPLIIAARWISLADLRAGRRSPALHPAGLKPLLIDLTVWGLALVLPAIILMSLYDVGPLVQQVVGQRLEARAAYVADDAFWPPRYERGTMFVQEDTALVLLALAGMGLAYIRRRRDRWLMLTWLGLAFLMLAVHNPIRYKHFLILIPPFAIFGSTVIAGWLASLRSLLSRPIDSPSTTNPSTPDRRTATRFMAVAGSIALLSLYLWQIPAALSLWRVKADVPQPPTDEVEALAFIDDVIGPNDCVITDDTPLVYWSRRMVPPELAEVSANRLISGALTLAELIAVSDRYDCQLVAAVSNRIPKYLPDYMDWVERKYLGRFHYGEDDLFFAKIDTDPNPGTPLWADFDHQLIFHGYDLPRTPAAPGDRVPLTLTWQAQTALDTDYTIFVQLRNQDNETLASADHQPYKGLAPTSTWPAGAVIKEFVWLHLPADLPAGRYPIYAGLYRPDNLERLPLLADTSGENALILGPLVVP